MKTMRHAGLALPLAAVLALTGCGRSSPGDSHAGGGHEHGGGHTNHDEGESPARFKEGQGLKLADETAAALGVETTEVEEREVTRTFEVTAAVFDAGPPARASSLVPVEVADAIEKHPPAEAKLVALRRDLSAALKQVEVILEVPGLPAVGSTINLTLRGAPSAGVAVPRSAVLRSATGSYVYVVNGAHLLRTLVETGATDGEYLEVLSGLYTGDVVVTAGVEQLWLTELRLTKGGGHSH